MTNASSTDVPSLALAIVSMATSALVLAVAPTSGMAFQIAAGISVASYIVIVLRRLTRLASLPELPSFLFIGGLGFWFYVPLALSASETSAFERRAAMVRATTEHGVTALVAVNLFALVAISALQIPLWKDRQWFPSAIGRAALIPTRGRLGILMLVSAACLGFYIVSAGGVVQAFQWAFASRSETKPWDPVGYAASSLSFFDMTATALLVGAGAVALYLAFQPNQSRALRAGFLITAASAIVWTALESGTRSIVIQTTMPAVAIGIHQIARRRHVKRLGRTLALTLFALAVVLLADVQRQYRTSAEVSGVSLQIQDNDFFTQTAFAVAVQEREGRLLRDSALLHIVSGPIPRALWPEKPMMTSMLVFTRYVWGHDVSDKGTNTLPSIVGQYYLNWGWIGIVEIALMLGLLLRFSDRAYTQGRDGAPVLLACVSISTYVFVSFRMLSFSYFAPMVATVALVALMARWKALEVARRPHPKSTSST